MKSYSLEYIDYARDWFTGTKAGQGFNAHEIERVNRIRDQLAAANSELAKLKNQSDASYFPESIREKFFSGGGDDTDTSFSNRDKTILAAFFAAIILALVGFYFPEYFPIFRGGAPDGDGLGGVAPTETGNHGT